MGHRKYFPSQGHRSHYPGEVGRDLERENSPKWKMNKRSPRRQRTMTSSGTTNAVPNSNFRFDSYLFHSLYNRYHQHNSFGMRLRSLDYGLLTCPRNPQFGRGQMPGSPSLQSGPVGSASPFRNSVSILCLRRDYGANCTFLFIYCHNIERSVGPVKGRHQKFN